MKDVLFLVTAVSNVIFVWITLIRLSRLEHRCTRNPDRELGMLRRRVDELTRISEQRPPGADE